MTQVVDFVNEPEEIRKAFEPYFIDAFLATETDPNLVHDLAAKLDTAAIYTQAEIDKCAEAFVKGKGNNALAAVIDPGKKRFAEAAKVIYTTHSFGCLPPDIGTGVRVVEP